VRTSSAEQVRKPLSKRGIGAWRNFAPWIEPLTQALGAVVDTYPEVPDSIGGDARLKARQPFGTISHA
jgi:hypothetical protein